MRDAVEARELKEGAEDFVEAVEGRVDLADVLPGIVSMGIPLVISVDLARVLISPRVLIIYYVVYRCTGYFVSGSLGDGGSDVSHFSMWKGKQC